MSDALALPVEKPPGLDLVLYPNPPLGRHGVAVVWLVTAAVGGALAIGFAAVGAWPVTGFLGLDVLLLGWALMRARRRARRAEIIRLDADGLLVRRLGPRGEAVGEVRLQPHWVQVVLDERRLHDPLLALRSHGRLVPIGGFLAAAERRELAHELRRALARHRLAPRR